MTSATLDVGELDLANVIEVVRSIRASLGELRFGLEIGEVANARRRRDQLIQHIDDNLIVRLLEVAAPLIVVTAGSTGAGKSTLVNSVLGEELTVAGVLRPTTRTPVLLHNPVDLDALRLLPIFEVVTPISTQTIAPGMALVDAPDLDSVVESNRDLADRLLGAADLWLFVTTASRYGDALPWSALHEAASRGVSIAVVLNRTEPESVPDIRMDLARRLNEQGLGSSPLFIIEDVGPHTGLLPAKVVESTRAWLASLVSPGRVATVIRRTQSGALRSLVKRASALAHAAREQEIAYGAARRIIRVCAQASIDHGVNEIRASSVISGEILTGWDTAFDTSLRKAIRASGRIRGRGRRARTRQRDLVGLGQVLEHALVATLESVGLEADTAIRQAWADGQATERLLAFVPEGVMSERRQQSTLEAASDWGATAHQEVRSKRASGDTRRIDRAITAVGHEGLEKIVLMAAAGVVGAEKFLVALLPADGNDLVLALQANLELRVRHQVNDEAAQFAQVLDDHRENTVALEQLVAAAESLRRTL